MIGWPCHFWACDGQHIRTGGGGKGSSFAHSGQKAKGRDRGGVKHHLPMGPWVKDQVFIAQAFGGLSESKL